MITLPNGKSIDQYMLEAALKIRYISSMSDGRKHGMSGGIIDSKLLSMSGLRAFSSSLALRNTIHASKFLATLSKNILNFHYSTKLGSLNSRFAWLEYLSLRHGNGRGGIFLAHIHSMFRTDILRNQHRVKNTEKYDIIKGALDFAYTRLAFPFP